MKEYWINVYADKCGEIWYGTPVRFGMPSWSNKLLYRIHVRLK